MKQKKIRKSGFGVTVDKAARADINVIVQRLGGSDAFGYISVRERINDIQEKLEDRLYYLEKFLGIEYAVDVSKPKRFKGYRKVKKCKSKK